MSERSWLATIVQGFGIGVFVLATAAWCEGRAGPVHAVMAVLAMVAICVDLIASEDWRVMFKQQKLPWQHSAVSAAIIGTVVFLGLTYGLQA
jgi:uncharacterized protein (DUF486 family)